MEDPHTNIDLAKLTPVRVLGRGATGTVFLVADRTTTASCPLALKVVEKSAAHSRPGAARRARWEISVLARLFRLAPHPFLPTLLGSLETENLLAWAIPYCPGGDLNALRHRLTDRTFSPSAIRFYVAEIVCALESLHCMGIVYRDLKPENVLIQLSGHVMLTDFDLSRCLLPLPSSDHPAPAAPHADLEIARSEPKKKRCPRSLIRILSFAPEKAKMAKVSPAARRTSSLCSTGVEKSQSFVGTEEYVAPEVVRGDGHEFAVDWWALGVLTYEMAYGKTPFRGRNKKHTFRNVVKKEPEFVGEKSDLTDFISGLLEKDPTQRLGYEGGAAEIKGHAFFHGLRWDLLTEVSRPPFLSFTEEETTLTKKITMREGLDIEEYLKQERQRALEPPPSLTPSLLFSSESSDCGRNTSLTEF